MNSQDRFQRLVSKLPQELKDRIIHWAVKIDKPIMSTSESASEARKIRRRERSAVLMLGGEFDSVPDPRQMFSADKKLKKVANEEFWKCNVFKVCDPGMRYANTQKHTGKLDHDVSRQPHIRHLIVVVMDKMRNRVINKEIEDTIGQSDVQNIQELLGLYPNLESLGVFFAYCSLQWSGSFLGLPLELMAWERQHFIKNIASALIQLEGPKWKSVSLSQSRRIVNRQGRMLCDPIDIDGRGRDLDELVCKMMDHPGFVVRLT